MQTPLYELDFSEIDLNNPFAITESSSPLQPKKSGISFSDSLPDLPESRYNPEEQYSQGRRNNRGHKVDDFDYSARIEEELQKMGEKADNPANKKKLIQKIRNKLSANRSRLRSKAEMKSLRDENSALKTVNVGLKHQIELFASENKRLIDDLFKNKTLASDIKTDLEDDSIVRENSKGERTHLKNLLFITAILLTVSFLPSVSRDNVKLSGVVPLLSIQKPTGKAKRHTIKEFCNKNLLPDNKCVPPKRYLYKLKQHIKRYKSSFPSEKTSKSQFKLTDFRNEVVSYKCYNSNDIIKNKERVFLFDKEFLDNVKDKTELHYVSETWPVEDINN